MGKKYYAVRKGRTPGLYESWAECNTQVADFPECEYKSFTRKNLAQAYLGSEDAVYRLEYDGASKGNPGKSGAGALLRHPDGSTVQELTIGLGEATNNFAEYHGLILGLRAALERNITCIQVQGDSDLVCKQVLGKWAVRNEKLVPLHAEVQALKKQFSKFTISHVAREFNAAADALANKGIHLKCLEVQSAALDNPSIPEVSELPESTAPSTLSAKKPERKTPASTGDVQSSLQASLHEEEAEKKSTSVKRRKTKDVINAEDQTYQLEFDGASKGNPGKAGAGALLRHPSGKVLEELTMGLGCATNNAAEYEALILGLQAAADRKITRIQVVGDSALVCKQVDGTWAVRNKNMIALHEKARDLIKRFTKFSIHFVERELNAAADILANRAIKLKWNEVKTKPVRQLTEGPLNKANFEKAELINDIEAVAIATGSKEEILVNENRPAVRKARSKKLLEDTSTSAASLSTDGRSAKNKKREQASKRSAAGQAGSDPVESIDTPDTGGGNARRKGRVAKASREADCPDKQETKRKSRAKKQPEQVEEEAGALRLLEMETVESSSVAVEAVTEVQEPIGFRESGGKLAETSKTKKNTRKKDAAQGKCEVELAMDTRFETTAKLIDHGSTRKIRDIERLSLGSSSGSLSSRRIIGAAASRLAVTCRSYHQLHGTKFNVQQVPRTMRTMFRTPVLASKGHFPRVCISTIAVFAAAIAVIG